jgi:hypothetical protein
VRIPADVGFAADKGTAARVLLERTVCASALVVRGKIVPDSVLLNSTERFGFERDHVMVEQLVRGSGVGPGDVIDYYRPFGAFHLGGENIVTLHGSYPRPPYNQPAMIFLSRVSGFPGYRAVLPLDVIAFPGAAIKPIRPFVDPALSGGWTPAQLTAAVRAVSCR